MGRAAFLPCCLTGSQTIVEVMKIMVTSFKRSHACNATLSDPNPAEGYCQHMPPPETPGHSRASLVSLLCGNCSFFLGPGAHKLLFAPSKSLFESAAHSIRQKIWKTQKWLQDWKWSVFTTIPKKGNALECSNYCTIALISHASKVNTQNSPSQALTECEPWISRFSSWI